jgi:hypothetical protein
MATRLGRQAVRRQCAGWTRRIVLRLLSEGYAPEASEREERERSMDNVRYCFHVFISFGCSSPRFADPSSRKIFPNWKKS